MRKPVISCIMPVRNSHLFLNRAIQSILGQTYSNFELIIVNDKSDNSTKEILDALKDKRIHIITNSKRLGVTGSLNRGLKIAKGEFIARMDADDISYPKRFEMQVVFLRKYTDVGIVGTAVIFIDSQGKKRGIKSFPASDKDLKYLLIYGNPFIHPTIMIRKKLLDTYGHYDLTLDGAEDYDLWLRLSQHTRLANIKRPLLYYRVHKHSVTWTKHTHVDTAYVKAKWKSVKKYHYPWWHLFLIVRTSIALLLPPRIKRYIYESTYGN